MGGLYKWGKDVSGDTCKESEDWRCLIFFLPQKEKKGGELTLFETNWPVLKQIDLVLEWIYFRFNLTLNIYIINILDFLCFFLFYLL